MFQTRDSFYFIGLISWGNVINIKISTIKLPLRHVPPIFSRPYKFLLSNIIEGSVQLGWYRHLSQLIDYIFKTFVSAEIYEMTTLVFYIAKCIHRNDWQFETEFYPRMRQKNLRQS